MNTMAPSNFTPLPDSLKAETSTKSRHGKVNDVLLLASFLIFVLSAGYWVQSTILQPGTNATQKIIETTPTPTPTVTENLQDAIPAETSEEMLREEQSPNPTVVK